MLKTNFFNSFFVQINFKNGGRNIENHTGTADEAQPSITRHSGRLNQPIKNFLFLIPTVSQDVYFYN